MNRKTLAVLLFFFAGYACNNPNARDKTNAPDSSRIKADSPTAMQNQKDHSPDTGRKRSSLFDSKEGYTLSYKTESLEQRLKLVRLSKDSMDFCLILTNPLKHISDTLSGGLMFVNSGGEESEQADDGSGFFYDNWNYTNKNGCQINFTIDKDSAHYVHLYDFDCAKKLKTPVPVETKHILKRVDVL